MKRIMLSIGIGMIGAAFAAEPITIELFNGKNLNGWTSVMDYNVTGGYSASEPTWSVQDGVIRTTGTPFGYLRTKRSDFADFKLHVEYRWWRKTAKPNSGIFVRLANETGACLPVCVENQLCLGSAGDVLGLAGMTFANAKPNSPYNPTKPFSGISRIAKRQASSEKPFGEWNVLEVEVKGGTLINRLNGVEQNRVTGIAVASGAIALQAEGGAAEFKNIRVEVLPTAAK